jgi:hypothetical protein
MFGVTYSVAISIDQLVEPVIDDVGFVYHGVTFEIKKKVYDETKGVMSFPLMLPHRDKSRIYSLLSVGQGLEICPG